MLIASSAEIEQRDVCILFEKSLAFLYSKMRICKISRAFKKVQLQKHFVVTLIVINWTTKSMIIDNI